jgi:hypothetical protein
MTLGPNVIKRFTAVIYHHPMVISSFFVIKLNYRGNYSGMEVNYHGILTLEKVCMKNTYCLFQIKFITEYPNVQHIIITQI